MSADRWREKAGRAFGSPDDYSNNGEPMWLVKAEQLAAFAAEVEAETRRELETTIERLPCVLDADLNARCTTHDELCDWVECTGWRCPVSGQIAQTSPPPTDPQEGA